MNALNLQWLSNGFWLLSKKDKQDISRLEESVNEEGRHTEEFISRLHQVETKTITNEIERLMRNDKT